MKLTLFVILLFVQWNHFKGNELDHERLEKMFHSLLTEIKDLSDQVSQPPILVHGVGDNWKQIPDNDDTRVEDEGVLDVEVHDDCEKKAH